MKNSPVRSIADIAKIAGVSKATVSRALNDSPLIRDEVKHHIRDIANRYDFEMNRGARNLSLMRSQTVALLIPASERMITDPFRIGMVGAVTNALSEHSYDLLLVQTHQEDQSWSRRILGSGRADALIIFSQPEHADGIAYLAERQAPFVVWSSPMQDQTYCSVSSDNRMGGYLATKHLVQNGRRKIAFLGGLQDERDIQMRLLGYQKALTEFDLPFAPDLITYGNYTSQSGYDEMAHLLNNHSDLDAVFVNSDVMATGSLEAIRASGLGVPSDIAVVGFDDIPLAVHLNPPLTTIRQDLPLAGQLLVENLFKIINTEEVTICEIPVELIVRASSVV